MFFGRFPIASSKEKSSTEEEKMKILYLPFYRQKTALQGRPTFENSSELLNIFRGFSSFANPEPKRSQPALNDFVTCYKINSASSCCRSSDLKTSISSGKIVKDELTMTTSRVFCNEIYLKKLFNILRLTIVIISVGDLESSSLTRIFIQSEIF